MKAFEVDAVNCSFLKAVSSGALGQRLAKSRLLAKPVETERLSHEEKILLDSDEEMRVVFVAEISVISAEGNYHSCSAR